MNKREIWADIARGIGMILIIIDHSQNFLSQYVSWFHLVIFFIISGYFFKPISSWNDFSYWAKKRILTLGLPYVSFLFLITIYRYILQLVYGNFNFIWYLKDILKIVYGGQYLTGYYAPFWYITCLIFTQILFAFLQLLIRNIKIQLLIISLAYLIAHIEANLIKHHIINFYFPLAIDVSLIALTYYSIGYYLKKYLKHINAVATLILAFISIVIIILYSLNIIKFEYELKYIQYTNFLLDFFIPIIFSITVLGISQYLEKVKILSLPLAQIGISSLTIMYLHLPINLILENFIKYNSFIFVCVGVIFPLLIEIGLKRNSFCRIFLLGDIRQIGFRKQIMNINQVHK